MTKQAWQVYWYEHGAAEMERYEEDNWIRAEEQYEKEAEMEAYCTAEAESYDYDSEWDAYVEDYPDDKEAAEYAAWEKEADAYATWLYEQEYEKAIAACTEAYQCYKQKNGPFTKSKSMCLRLANDAFGIPYQEWDVDLWTLFCEALQSEDYEVAITQKGMSLRLAPAMKALSMFWQEQKKATAAYQKYKDTLAAFQELKDVAFFFEVGFGFRAVVLRIIRFIKWEQINHKFGFRAVVLQCVAVRRF